MSLVNENGSNDPIKGFFKDFYVEVQKSCTDEQLKNFANLENDLSRFAFVNSLDAVKKLNLNIECEKKSLQTAIELKNKGNLLFQHQQWLAALDFYNKSLIATPSENAQETSILLANRSAALYHIENYDLSLRDIELAEESYPKNMLHKLMERKARCYLAKKEFESALDAFKKTITRLDESNLPFEKRAKIEKDAQIMIKMLPKQIETEKKAREKADKFKKLERKPKPNPLAESNKKGLSKSVSFGYSEMEGHYAKADQNIKVGENILVERPHCSMLLEQFAKTHCQNCFERTVAPLVCPTCVNVIFCSTKCRNDALNTYHKYECNIMNLLWTSGSSVNCHMALRMISQQKPEYFQRVKNDLVNGITFEDTLKYKTDDYRKIYNLVRHEQTRGATSFMQYSIMSYFLTECLKIGKYFETINDSDFIGSLILRNLQFLQFNTHEVYELEECFSNKKLSKTVFIGGGLYPTLALFNHNCNPGIVRYFKGNAVHVHAIANIKPGGVIAENYGPIYSQEKFEVRQEKMKKLYWFDCNCQPCQENWVDYDHMSTSMLRFRCDADQPCDNVITIPLNCNEFMIKCDRCGQHTNILKGLKAVQDTDSIDKTAKRLYNEGNYEKAFEKNLEMINIMDEVMAPPFRDYCNCQQSIKDCLVRRGNKNIVP